jgi:hypothetical protein
MSRMSQKHSRESMEIGTDGMVVIAMVVATFMLQVWHLKSALLPATDEGVYALIGKLMLKGYVPHSDFPMWHMPLLPLLSGIGLWLTGSMYPLRIAYLAVNCLVAIPLFSSLKRATSSPLAAMTAIAFYLTFHEMIDHDFRLLALDWSTRFVGVRPGAGQGGREVDDAPGPSRCVFGDGERDSRRATARSSVSGEAVRQP